MGATITGAFSKTRRFRYSAIVQSLRSLRCGPCSFDAAPSGITTTDSGVSFARASTQVRLSRRTPLAPAGAGAGAPRVATVGAAGLKEAAEKTSAMAIPTFERLMFVSHLPKRHPIPGNLHPPLDIRYAPPIFKDARTYDRWRRAGRFEKVG